MFVKSVVRLRYSILNLRIDHRSEAESEHGSLQVLSLSRWRFLHCYPNDSPLAQRRSPNETHSEPVRLSPGAACWIVSRLKNDIGLAFPLQLPASISHSWPSGAMVESRVLKYDRMKYGASDEENRWNVEWNGLSWWNGKRLWIDVAINVVTCHRFLFSLLALNGADTRLAAPLDMGILPIYTAHHLDHKRRRHVYTRKCHTIMEEWRAQQRCTFRRRAIPCETLTYFISRSQTIYGICKMQLVRTCCCRRTERTDALTSIECASVSQSHSGAFIENISSFGMPSEW